MTKEEIDEVKTKRAELDKRRAELQREKIRLNAEYAAIYTICTHPGLKLGKDEGGEPDGECEICGDCW